jgi:hypothetical protein
MLHACFERSKSSKALAKSMDSAGMSNEREPLQMRVRHSRTFEMITLFKKLNEPVMLL